MKKFIKIPPWMSYDVGDMDKIYQGIVYNVILEYILNV